MSLLCRIRLVRVLPHILLSTNAFTDLETSRKDLKVAPSKQRNTSWSNDKCFDI